MNTALKIYISNENLAESLNYFSTCTLLLLIITIEGMLYFGKRRKTKMEHVLIISICNFETQALIKDHQWRHLLSTMQLHHHPGENQVFLRDGVYYKLVLYHNCFFVLYIYIYSVFTKCLFYSQEYICNIEYPDDRDKF